MTVSRVARRSGVAVFSACDHLQWQPDVVLQVGVGFHSAEVEVMKEAWPDVYLMGCEPNPRIIEWMKGNYPGKAYECAISDWKGKGTLYSKRLHADGSSLFTPKEEKMKKYDEIEIEVTTLDDLFPDPERYGEHILLWLDCEGSELNALKGGQNFLEYVGIVNLELTTIPKSKKWCNAIETHHWLIDRGFKRQAAHTQRSSGGQCDAIYVRNELFRIDYCCCPCSF